MNGMGLLGWAACACKSAELRSEHKDDCGISTLFANYRNKFIYFAVKKLSGTKAPPNAFLPAVGNI
jgi:hypothetical protein